jgi:glyoxylate/hydroxypyruvate reductase
MPVLIATDLPPEENRTWRDALERALPQERFVVLRDEAGDAGTIDIAVVANPPPGALAGLPGLRLIQSLWAGVDRLLADPGLPADVPLARMVDPALAAAMAETALWAVLGLQRGFFDYAGQQAAREWRQLPQRRADETRVAVLGLGAMGRAVAARLAQQGLRVTGWSASGRAPIDGVALRSGAGALPSLLAAADIVVNLLPLTDATRGLFDAGVFASMRRGAGFVNLARGAQVV